MRQVADLTEHLSTLALNHVASFCLLNDDPTLRTLPVVQVLQKVLELPVIGLEPSIDLGCLTSHALMPGLVAFQTLFYSALRTAEVSDVVFLLSEAVVLASWGGAANDLGGVFECVILETQRVEPLDLGVIENEGDVGDRELIGAVFVRTADGELGILNAGHDVLPETGNVKGMGAAC